MAPASEGEMASNGGTGERFLPLAWFAETTGLAFVDETNLLMETRSLMHCSIYLHTYVHTSLSPSLSLSPYLHRRFYTM